MSDSKIMSDSHWLGRIKDLMQQVGMPASQSLYLAFTQLMFEMQRAHLATRPTTPEAAIAAWNSRTALAAAQEPIAWYLPDDNGLPFRATCYDFEAVQWQQKGHKVFPLYAGPYVEAQLADFAERD